MRPVSLIRALIALGLIQLSDSKRVLSLTKKQTRREYENVGGHANFIQDPDVYVFRPNEHRIPNFHYANVSPKRVANYETRWDSVTPMAYVHIKPSNSPVYRQQGLTKKCMSCMMVYKPCSTPTRIVTHTYNNGQHPYSKHRSKSMHIVGQTIFNQHNNSD